MELYNNRETRDNNIDTEDNNNDIRGNDNDFQTVEINDLHSDVIQQTSGTITEIVQDGYGFTIKDSTGQIQVDTPLKLDLTPGEQVTVIGEYSNSGGQIIFDGLNVTKVGGTVAFNPIGSTGVGDENDILDGNAEANKLDGSLGNDYIAGRSDNDTLIGGDSQGILIGGFSDNPDWRWRCRPV